MGKVIAVGAGVENVKVGDTVGIVRCDAGVEVWGTLADKAVIPAASLAAIPKACKSELKFLFWSSLESFMTAASVAFKEIVPLLPHPTLSGRDDWRTLIARQHCRRLRIK